MKEKYDPMSPTEEMRQLFAPHTILPVQFPGGANPEATLQGEQRLLVAILADAIYIYRKHRAASRPRNRTLFRETERWIESTDRKWVFSFERICEALRFDPQCVRHAVLGRRKPMHEPVMVPLIGDGWQLRQASGG
jgi:hypothetical protein